MVLVMGTSLLQHRAGFWGLLHDPGSWSPSDLSGTLMSTETAPLPCPDSAHPPSCSLASLSVPSMGPTLKIQNLTPTSLSAPALEDWGRDAAVGHRSLSHNR